MATSKDLVFLAKVFEQEMVDVLTLVDNADNHKTRAKTAFHKAAYMALAQLTELLLYMLVIKYEYTHPTCFDGMTKKEHRRIYEFSRHDLATKKHIYVAEQYAKPIAFEDVSKSFSQLLDFCRQKGLIQGSFLRQVKNMRTKRNEIHPQLRLSTSRSYTRSAISRLGKINLRIIQILDAI